MDKPDGRGAGEGPAPNVVVRRVLLEAYRPCGELAGACKDMRWNPSAGHVPRGFCGATGELGEVELVLVMAEPGDPHEGEFHPDEPEPALLSAYRYAYRCYEVGKDLYHRNVRVILDLCFPGLTFDAQMRRTWMTESVLCSASSECGAVPRAVEVACRARYLDAQLALFPRAVVVALGGKAAKRLSGREVTRASAAAPPGCNFKGARESWEAVGRMLRERGGHERSL